MNKETCVANFYCRNGGVSKEHYHSLNTSINSQDELTNINANIKLIAKDINCEYENLKLVNQVHGNDVFIIDDANIDSRDIKADAIVTNLRNVALGINTADCTPVLFIDAEKKIIGAAHAGWRSAISGILQNTVKKMQELGANKKNIVAVIGPTIAQKSYEVDTNFKEEFVSKDFGNIVYFSNSVKASHFMFDLPSYCSDRLKSMGIKKVDNLNLDTYTNEDLFFSCRRSAHKGSKIFGGQLSVIMLK